ncbi:arginine--tRNA ligase [Candidatus Beckwithbacteria bacterium]|nr:arginine--tRNA ligase [Candidatus Beckwithbacteria bacterium]
MNFEKIISDAIQKTLVELNLNLVERFELEHPVDETHGDYACNIAMIIFPLVKGGSQIKIWQGDFKNPRQLAQVIKTNLDQNEELKTIVEKIEIAGPGFINFYLKTDILINQISLILEKKDDFGKNENPENRKIIVEYGHPNTHKLPHIGHLFSYIAGDSLARILEFNGNTILKANYQGDIGPHVAKCIYGWQQKGKPIPEKLENKVKLLQECYQLGSELYEDENHKQKIIAINKAIYDPQNDIQKDWLQTRQWSLDFYLEFEKLLGVNQKKHYLESQMWQRGLQIVKDNVGKVFEKSGDTVIFAGEKFGLHTRVFITKEGTPTYEAKDLGLFTQKMEDWPFDLTITPTASEQNEYFNVVIEAVNQLFPEYKNKWMHIGFGMVSLSTGKMSSRKGNILSAPDLIEIVFARVGQIIEKRKELNSEEKEKIRKQVGLGAIKYAFLKSSLTKNMVFDLEESISLNGNSGPYLQYTYARCQSVLSKNNNPSFTKRADAQQSEDLNQEELFILKWLYRFPEIVEKSAKEFAPNHLCTYLYDLAQRYNTFYNKHSILKAENERQKQLRLALTQATAQVIKNGLKLLGINAPNTM